ncbi:hypothetical protein PV326_009954, partial [Microctonus aethiopoides]
MFGAAGGDGGVSSIGWYVPTNGTLIVTWIQRMELKKYPRRIGAHHWHSVTVT